MSLLEPHSIEEKAEREGHGGRGVEWDGKRLQLQSSAVGCFRNILSTSLIIISNSVLHAEKENSGIEGCCI